MSQRVKSIIYRTTEGCRHGGSVGRPEESRPVFLIFAQHLQILTCHDNDAHCSATARSGSAVVTGVALALVMVLIALQQVLVL
jgi:hypothetical protein